MIELRFRGWFQVRLATDPDPYDEPRGISGYVNAYAGEPDLDRRICLQPPAFVRSHGPGIGVNVDAVVVDGAPDANHPLLNAAVDLLDDPKFEGRNGVIAEDGLEPIYPFRLQIAKDDFILRRAIVPKNPAFPYPEFLAAGVESAPNEIRDATGISDLAAIWRDRVTKLNAELAANPPEPERTAIAERLAFLQRNLARNGGVAGFFVARMRYDYALSSAVDLEDPADWAASGVDTARSWRAAFWMGGWDADVLCGYCRGSLLMPKTTDALDPVAVGARSLRRPERAL